MEAGTYIIETNIPSAETVVATSRNILESYHDTYDGIVDLQAETNLLDIGCGHGHFLLCARERGVTRISAMDLGRRQVALCRDLGFQAEQITDIPSALRPRGAYDVIHMSHVIEHISKEKLTRTLIALREALSPSGVLLLRTPNMSHWMAGHSRYLDTVGDQREVRISDQLSS